MHGKVYTCIVLVVGLMKCGESGDCHDCRHFKINKQLSMWTIQHYIGGNITANSPLYVYSHGNTRPTLYPNFILTSILLKTIYMMKIHQLAIAIATSNPTIPQSLHQSYPYVCITYK